jgi:integrase
MRIGEACRLKWIDLDPEHNTVTVNEPEKNSQPRMFKIDGRLAAMLNALPRINDRVFAGMMPRSVAVSLSRLRKKVAQKPWMKPRN